MAAELKVDLPAEPLFQMLFELTKGLREREVTPRVIGGLAMFLLERSRHGQPRVTEDIDLALPSSEWPTEAEAEETVAQLSACLKALNLSRDDSEESKASRTARFTYRNPEDPTGLKVEVICGDLPYGQPSRRPPAHRVVQRDGEPTFYASKLPWIDHVPSWVCVDLTLSDGKTTLEIPDEAGMLLLKAKAVVDKYDRIREIVKELPPKDPPRDLEYEQGRFERHARDLIRLHDFALEAPRILATYNATVRSWKPAREISDRLSRLTTSPPPSPASASTHARLRTIAVDL